MASVELKGISKRYGAVEVIRNLDLTVDEGSFCALLGPSGCGKSTLLRMIAGLESITEGSVLIGGTDVTNLAPSQRRVAMVFQSYALYPHLTVRDNICFSLSLAGVSRDVQNAKAAEIAKMLQLEELLDRRPAQLSGGQRQRVAIGRALVRKPEVFLFDEPLSNLDALLRVQMRLELAKLHQNLKTTMIYVTHDQVEAMTLADKIVVLDKGRISQAGAPLELYNSPANRFVASFIGSPAMNFIPGTVKTADGTAVTVDMTGAQISIRRRDSNSATPSGPIEIGIRPEHIDIVEVGDKTATTQGIVQIVEQLGNSTIAYVETPIGHVVVEGDGGIDIAPNDQVGLRFDATRSHMFGADGHVV
ncbi:MAG: ABC transporter ATP-binding protein [Rhizobiaceae bacterium]